MSTETQPAGTDGAPQGASRDSLSITDNRTGQQYEVPIADGTIRAHRAAQDQGQRGRLRPHDV